MGQRSLLCIPFTFGVIYLPPAVLHNTHRLAPEA
jgi:hypothetical protein